MGAICLRVPTRSADHAAHLCRADESAEKTLTLGGSKAPLTLASSGDAIQRIPGIGLVFADSVSEVPPVFTHMLENLPAIFETVVFVTVR